ncbi:MAG: HU family DNA-binding protein [bacterium]|nr:HU family DNA-binding protein [bacterium]
MAMKYDKKWLAEWLMNKLGTTKKAAQEAVEEMFGEIAKAMVKGEQVKIAGFGVFRVARRAAREGINPRTQEKIQIAAKVAPKFRAAKQLKEMVQ